MATISEETRFAGVLRETRAGPPSDYLFKVESFSLFSECGCKVIESSEFEAGGQQWRIVFYLNGEDEGYGEYISAYLSVAEESSLGHGKEVNAFFKLFLCDQIRGKYLSVQGSATRFDRVKYKWGFSKFLSLKDFKKPSNGYLVNDTCFLGAEVYVMKSLGLRECLSIEKLKNLSYKSTWRVKRIREWVEAYRFTDEYLFSDIFDIGGFKWRLCLCPNGEWGYRGCSLSMYLELVGSPHEYCVDEVKAHYTIRLTDHINQKCVRREDTNWFDAHSGYDFKGFDPFIQLDKLLDTTKGFVVDGCCEFEAEVTLLCDTYRESLDC